ncbi:unknown [Enterocloster bolteae CAG:59]|nr:unknown [Enterocloster bolteae CAG:59]
MTPSAPSCSQYLAKSTLACVVMDAALKNTGILPFTILITSCTMAFFSSNVSRVTSPAEPRIKICEVPYFI